MSKTLRRFVLAMGATALAGLAGDLACVAVSPAHAVVGMPATPVSYAGVARRTTRREVAATGAVAAPVATAAVVGTAAAVTTAAVVGTRVAALPPGCTTVMAGGVAYSQCGGAYYRPYYEGTNVVYVVSAPP
jgi:hypothetical protein